MARILDWREMRERSARLLEERTGEGVESWSRRLEKERFEDETKLRKWLKKKGVTGYPQSLLVMERFGYPDFMRASADELIDGQYADRPHLRPIFDAVVGAASGLGEVVIQARKTFVSLVSARRTFARVQATTKTRVDVSLRLEERRPGPRLRPSRLHEGMPFHISLTTRREVDSELMRWLRKAYRQNA